MNDRRIYGHLDLATRSLAKEDLCSGMFFVIRNV